MLIHRSSHQGSPRTETTSNSPPSVRSKNTAEPVRGQLSKNALVSRDFLLTLADDYRSGRIDGKEANSRFINAVVDNSLDKKLSDNDKKRLIEDITDFFSQDQNFLHDLEKNLNRLT